MLSIHDKSRAINILYLDFQKAFDKLPHKRLMVIVKSPSIIRQSRILDRSQRVVVNGASSGQ